MKRIILSIITFIGATSLSSMILVEDEISISLSLILSVVFGIFSLSVTTVFFRLSLKNTIALYLLSIVCFYLLVVHNMALLIIFQLASGESAMLQIVAVIFLLQVTGSFIVQTVFLIVRKITD